MAEQEQDQVLAEEPTSTEVTELDDQSLEDASGGSLQVPYDDVNNSSCNGNCGC